MGQPGLFFVYFRSFLTQNLQKTVRVSGIRTRIVRVEGEHTDRLTTTTAQTVFYTANYSGPNESLRM